MMPPSPPQAPPRAPMSPPNTVFSSDQTTTLPPLPAPVASAFRRTPLPTVVLTALRMAVFRPW